MRKVSRLCRRIILKNFGSYKKFSIFLCAICATAYVFKSVFLQNFVQDDVPRSEQINNFSIVVVTEAAPPPVCGIDESCPYGRYRFYLKSGHRDTDPAIICFKGKDYIGKGTINGRGMNIVVINELTMEVEDVQTFDTYTTGEPLHAFLTHNVTDYRIILMTTQDDPAKNLMGITRTLLTRFGSTKINSLQFRDALVLVGQKGLTQGSGIERYVRRYLNRDFADIAELTGCLKSAVGKLSHFVVDEVNPDRLLESNCLIAKQCGPAAFPVHIFTGYQNTDPPKLCVSGKYIPGMCRGFNVAVVDPKTKNIIKSGNFDTYEFSNTSLDKYLQSVNTGEIVVAVTHDEVTMHLTQEIKQGFESLGSYYITKLAMRDSWTFIGQRGLNGRSPFEDIEFAPPGGSTWSEAIDRKLCVPTLIKGFTLMPEDAERNIKRQEFCKNYVGYGEFCSGEKVDEMINAAALKDDTLVGHDIFSIPILVVPGANRMAFRMQLESLVSTPGIRKEMVFVYFSADFEKEYTEFVELFSFKSFPLKLSNTSDYSSLLTLALDSIWLMKKDAEYLMVFEEEVVARRHYLSFMAQSLDVIKKDESLIGVNSWNENGYTGTSSLPGVVYRTESFPGFGFLLKKSFYDQNMKDNMASCCSKRSWNGWLSGKLSGKEMLVPDTSFVLRRPVEDTTHSELLTHLFNRPRIHQRFDPILIRNKENLVNVKYEEYLKEAIESAVAVKITDAASCKKDIIPPDVSGKNFAIYFEQNDANDEKTLSFLCRCFNLFSLKDQKLRGKHRGLIRFSKGENHVFLIGSKTSYFSFKPNSINF